MNLLFGFSGRIGRGQWWLGQLAIMLVSVICIAGLATLVGFKNLEAAAKTRFDNVDASVVAVLFAATALTVWISFALAIKRFHDRDKSGFWSLIVFVPYVGALWQFVECGFFSGTSGSNRFGLPGGLGAVFGLADRLNLDGAPLRQAGVAPAPEVSGTAIAASPLGRFQRSAKNGFGRRGV